ncbi:MAG TPA: hypothetical protein VHQ22_20115 [Terriglobales bacterium]|jgi:hypothetical protein|nr:hypothetical protein [Terriglobales bacterium]
MADYQVALMTNNHEFNAREDEPTAAPADLEQQALHTKVEFDIDSADAAGHSVRIAKLLAANFNCADCWLRRQRAR